MMNNKETLKNAILEHQRNQQIYKPEKWINCDEMYYLKLWKVDSDYFADKGYYEWMAKTLKSHVSPKTLLDIGCGTGKAIIQLLKTVPSLEHIITVELNTHCINEAKRKLK